MPIHSPSDKQTSSLQLMVEEYISQHVSRLYRLMPLLDLKTTIRLWTSQASRSKKLYQCKRTAKWQPREHTKFFTNRWTFSSQSEKLTQSGLWQCNSNFRGYLLYDLSQWCLLRGLLFHDEYLLTPKQMNWPHTCGHLLDTRRPATEIF